MTERTHDKNDEECKTCKQAYLPQDERACEFFHGESPSTWILKWSKADGSELFAVRYSNNPGIGWEPGLLNASGFFTAEDAREAADSFPLQMKEMLHIIPVTVELLQEAEKLASENDDFVEKEAERINAGIEQREFLAPHEKAPEHPFDSLPDGVSAMEMDPESPMSTFALLVSALSEGMRKKKEAEKKTKVFDAGPMAELSAMMSVMMSDKRPPISGGQWATFDEMVDAAGPLVKLFIGGRSEDETNRMRERFMVRKRVAHGMESMIDLIDGMGVEAVICNDKPFQAALVECRRIVCQALYGQPYVKARINLRELHERVSAEVNRKPAPAAGPAQEAPAPVNDPDFGVPVHKAEEVEWAVAYQKTGGEGELTAFRDYGVVRAKFPEDAIEVIIDRVHPYKPQTSENADANATIAFDRGAMRRHMIANRTE
jgi:hypothetical protein